LVANIHEPDVVVFAIETAKNGLIEPLEIVHSNQFGPCQSLLNVITVSFTAIGLR
jgi:hypothetical protein